MQCMSQRNKVLIRNGAAPTTIQVAGIEVPLLRCTKVPRRKPHETPGLAWRAGAQGAQAYRGTPSLGARTELRLPATAHSNEPPPKPIHRTGMSPPLLPLSKPPAQQPCMSSMCINQGKTPSPPARRTDQRNAAQTLPARQDHAA